MPRSEDVANSFVSGGRGGSVDQSDSYPVEPCYPEGMGKLGPFNANGKSNVVPEGVSYDRSLNPDSIRMFPHNENFIRREVADKDADDV